MTKEQMKLFREIQRKFGIKNTNGDLMMIRILPSEWEAFKKEMRGF